MHLAPVLLHGELKNWIGRTNGAGAAFEAVARATTTTMMLVSRGLPLGRLDVGFGGLGGMLVSWAGGVGGRTTTNAPGRNARGLLSTTRGVCILE